MKLEKKKSSYIRVKILQFTLQIDKKKLLYYKIMDFLYEICYEKVEEYTGDNRFQFHFKRECQKLN